MLYPRLKRTLLCVSGAWALACAHAGAAQPDARQIELGRRIYEQGILPDGTPLIGSRARGADAACINCHRKSGYGSMEGRNLVPPIAGAALFAPGALSPGASGRPRSGIERFRARSAYDEDSLTRALHQGMDPDGTPLGPLMQRYPLDAKAVYALAAYLRHLSDGKVPGVEEGTLHLGTVVAPGVPPRQRDAVLSVLRAYAKIQGQWGMKWQLHVWELAGPPQSWPAQLDAYYRQQPVFALLSGIGASEWSPVQRFCERNRVACVLPSLDLAPEGDDAYYSLYFSPGLTLEARLLAHHLRSGPTRHLIQVADDESGRRAADALRQALADDKSVSVRDMSLQEYGLAQVLQDDAVVFWLRPDALRKAAAKPVPAGEVFLSSLLADPDDISLSPTWKAKLRYLSAFDPLAESRARVVLRPWLGRQGLDEQDLRLRADAYAACSFFNAAVTAVQSQSLRGVSGPLNRERVLEAMESVMTVFRDDTAPFYWQMSLGPGQRIPVRGATMLRYESPDSDELVAEERIVP